MTNPLVDIQFDVPFEAIRAEHVEPAIDQLLADAKTALTTLGEDSQPAAYDTTLGALESLGENLGYAMGVVGHLESVATYPWIRIPSLASHLLACLQRQLPDDWQQRYRLRPVLLETFCETPRFEGTCYRAANWIHLGQTQGRGKLDTRHEYNQPVKKVFVKPLCPDWKQILNR